MHSGLSFSSGAPRWTRWSHSSREWSGVDGKLTLTCISFELHTFPGLQVFIQSERLDLSHQCFDMADINTYAQLCACGSL